MASKSKPRKRKAPGPSRTGSTRSWAASEEPSSRYTPPNEPTFRIRPEWHKAVGIASIVFGFALFLICQLNIFGWWLGLFDRPPPKPRPR
jgi:hypothetical protein